MFKSLILKEKTIYFTNQKEHARNLYLIFQMLISSLRKKRQTLLLTTSREPFLTKAIYQIPFPPISSMTRRTYRLKITHFGIVEESSRYIHTSPGPCYIHTEYTPSLTSPSPRCCYSEFSMKLLSCWARRQCKCTSHSV